MILRQGLQTSAKGVSENFNSSIPNKRLGSGPLGDRGQSLAPQRVFSRALSAPRAPSHWSNRARARRASSSLGTAGDPRADAQTDRRRGAGRSPAAPESVNQRRRGLLLSPFHPALLCSLGALSGALTGGHTWPGAPRLAQALP